MEAEGGLVPRGKYKFLPGGRKKALALRGEEKAFMERGHGEGGHGKVQGT